MFIIVALMTFVVAILGFFIWPGTPDIPNKLFLSEDELEQARKRLHENGTGVKNQAVPKPTAGLLKAIFTDWKVYVITFWNILFWEDYFKFWGSLTRIALSWVGINNWPPHFGELMAEFSPFPSKWTP